MIASIGRFRIDPRHAPDFAAVIKPVSRGVITAMHDKARFFAGRPYDWRGVRFAAFPLGVAESGMLPNLFAGKLVQSKDPVTAVRQKDHVKAILVEKGRNMHAVQDAEFAI